MVDHIPPTITIDQIPPEIRDFLENLLQEAEVSVADEVRDEMVLQLFEQLERAITAQIINNLPTKEDCQAFIQMNTEQKSQQDIQQFLSQKIPNLQELMANTFIEFRNAYGENATSEK